MELPLRYQSAQVFYEFLVVEPCANLHSSILFTFHDLFLLLNPMCCTMPAKIPKMHVRQDKKVLKNPFFRAFDIYYVYINFLLKNFLFFSAF